MLCSADCLEAYSPRGFALLANSPTPQSKEQAERMRIAMVVSVLWIQLAVCLFGQYPITAMPQDEAEDTSGACAPRDCVYSEWTLWSDCTEECGDAGVRQRVRHLLSDGACGSTCNGSLAESEPCNVRCCPTNCAYSPWNAWLYCRCSDNECEQVRPLCY